jgi:hypothetical protein
MKPALSVKVKFNRFSAIGRAMHGKVSAAVAESTHALNTNIKLLIAQKGIIDTGNYLNSWQVSVEGLTGYAYSNVHYGPYQEYGTHKMAARPHVLPAANMTRPFFVSQVEKALKAA